MAPIKPHHRKEVVVCVKGGVAEVLESPSDTTVIIKDYDVEGCDESRLAKDNEGAAYIAAVFNGGTNE